MDLRGGSGQRHRPRRRHREIALDDAVSQSVDRLPREVRGTVDRRRGRPGIGQGAVEEDTVLGRHARLELVRQQLDIALGDAADRALDDDVDLVAARPGDAGHALDQGRGAGVAARDLDAGEGDDLLLALIGHGDERAILHDEPDDGVGCLLVGHLLHDAGNQVLGQDAQVGCDVAIGLQAVDQLVQGLAVVADEDQRLAHAHRADPLGFAEGVGLHVEIGRAETSIGVRLAQHADAVRGADSLLGQFADKGDAVDLPRLNAEPDAVVVDQRLRGAHVVEVEGLREPLDMRLLGAPGEGAARFVETDEFRPVISPPGTELPFEYLGQIRQRVAVHAARHDLGRRDALDQEPAPLTAATVKANRAAHVVAVEPGVVVDVVGGVERQRHGRRIIAVVPPTELDHAQRVVAVRAGDVDFIGVISDGVLEIVVADLATAPRALIGLGIEHDPVGPVIPLECPCDRCLGDLIGMGLDPVAVADHRRGGRVGPPADSGRDAATRAVDPVEGVVGVGVALAVRHRPARRGVVGHRRVNGVRDVGRAAVVVADHVVEIGTILEHDIRDRPGGVGRAGQFRRCVVGMGQRQHVGGLRIVERAHVIGHVFGRRLDDLAHRTARGEGRIGRGVDADREGVGVDHCYRNLAVAEFHHAADVEKQGLVACRQTVAGQRDDTGVGLGDGGRRTDQRRDGGPVRKLADIVLAKFKDVSLLGREDEGDKAGGFGTVARLADILEAGALAQPALLHHSPVRAGLEGGAVVFEIDAGVQLRRQFAPAEIGLQRVNSHQ